MVIAGQTVNEPLDVWVQYGSRRRTATSLRRYDLADRGNPDVLTAVEAARSRIIISHVTHEEASWFASQARTAPWTEVPADADLREADPRERGGLYDSASLLHEHFLHAAPAGIRSTKVHKVLHIKRPGLFPVLDDRLWRLYRSAATEAAASLADARPGNERLYWAAVRADLLDPSNQEALRVGRAELAGRDGVLGQMATLSDLRLLDIVAWRLGGDA